MTRVLVTGACGNIGAHVVDTLIPRGYAVRTLDLGTGANRRVARRWGSRVDTRFGNVCDPRAVEPAVSGVDHVVHLAAMTPPQTDIDQSTGYAVNVVGTREVVAACEASPVHPRVTFTSTAAIWGRNDESKGPRRADEEISPSDNYTRQKAECEALLRDSALDIVILRIAMTPPVTLAAISPFIFDMHPDLRVEFTHPKDQALGIVNSLTHQDRVVGITLSLGGGAANRYRYREWLNLVFAAMGLPPMPRSAFGNALFLTDWVDSEESQAILNYQRRDLQVYLEDIRRELGPARHVIGRAAPALGPLILAHSRPHAASNGRPATIPELIRGLTTLRRAIRSGRAYL